MTTSRKATLVAVAALTLIGGREYVVRYFPATPAPLEAGATLPHMDHTPRHGGLVLMNGDTHFEVVLDKGGACRVYFTDAVRAELPASIASQVSVGVSTADAARKTVELQMDDAARIWGGQLETGRNPDAIVRVTYTGPEGPYWIDVPLSAWPDIARGDPAKTR